MTTVQYQSQINVDLKEWFPALSVPSEYGVEGPGSQWTLSALGNGDNHPRITDEEAEGPLVQGPGAGLRLQKSNLDSCLPRQ